MLSSSTPLQEGQEVTLAGYGITQTNPHSGAGTLRKTTVRIAQPRFGDTEILFDQRDGHGACHGDSGGPALITLRGKTYLIGVTNRGYQDPNDTCGQFAVYTRVAAYKSFITRAAAALRAAH
jgi:hypothetical protein